VPEEFDISDESRGGATVISPSGEVDIATAGQLRDRVDQVIERTEGTVVVDLTSVTFIDSTGLGVLIGARKRCVEDGRTLRVVIAEPRILKVFEITGLTELFDIRPTAELALDD
jgi:anti-sigma B factor antagonist